MKTPSQDVVMGLHCIEELFKYYPKRLLEVFVQDSMKQNPRKKTLCRRLEEKNIPLRRCSKHLLESLCGSSSHQGFVARIKKREISLFPSFLEKEQRKQESRLLLLDRIQDPHNVGAIFRSAECFGVDAVIFSNKQGPSITPSVSKVSSGASEHLRLVGSSSLANSVAALQKAGYQVLAASLTEHALDAARFSYSSKWVLILGAEGSGIHPSLLKKVDQELYIPMRGKLHSLNVASAAAVFLAFATQ